jgi:hypothetical protein
LIKINSRSAAAKGDLLAATAKPEVIVAMALGCAFQ